MKLEKARISVQVQPNAKRNELLGFRDGVLYLKIAAPAVQGRANTGLIEYLAEVLGLPKSRITVEKGAASRRKLVDISGTDPEAVRRLIETYAENR